MPSREELRSISDYDRYNSAINMDYFPNTQSSNYWSSSACAYSTNLAWNIDFSNGYSHGYEKTNTYYVRGVRGGQPRSFDNLINNGDGTITDTDTGLTWQQSAPNSEMTWKDALDYCTNLSLGGHNDWRLPNIKELSSLVDLRKPSPSINTEYFLNTTSYYYWSSTTSADKISSAWNIDFGGGRDSYYNKTALFYVRAVRTGQVLQECYTQEQLNQAIAETVSKYDPNADGKIGLEVAIHALKIVSGAINSE